MLKQQSRILFKTDTVENWESVENDFLILKGELYFYNNFFDTNDVNHIGNKIYKPFLKIGDGSSNLLDLPFLNNTYIKNSEIDDLFSSNVIGKGVLDSLILA